MVLQISYILGKKLKGTAMAIMMRVSSSSYIIYLFHTTFEGFAKSIIHRIPILNGESQVMFAIGAIIVIASGIVLPILLHKYILDKNRITKFLFGLK